MREKDSEIENRIRGNGYLESIYDGKDSKKELINKTIN
jgi:hypothetical protein